MIREEKNKALLYSWSYFGALLTENERWREEQRRRSQEEESLGDKAELRARSREGAGGDRAQGTGGSAQRLPGPRPDGSLPSFFLSHLQHMEVPRLGLIRATAAGLYHRQRRIPNPVSEARDQTHVLMDLSQVHYR